MLIGIIGYGSIGSRHSDNLRAIGIDPVILTKRRDVREYKVVHTWQALAKLGHFDALFITNETGQHAVVIKRALTLNPRALFVEKPLAADTRNLPALTAQVKSSSVSIWVGYNFHFFEPFLRIKKFIKQNRIGKLYYFRVSAGQDLSAWRKRNYRQIYSAKRAAGGGVVGDLVHDFNYPAWMLGEGLRVVASAVDKISTLKIDTEDFAETVLKSDSGVYVAVHQDYIRVPMRRSLEISGSRGSILWDSESETITLSTPNRTQKFYVSVDRNDMYKRELRFFIDSLRRGRHFSNLDEAMHDVRLICDSKRYGRQR